MDEILDIMEEHDVSRACAQDVIYLRTRSRHTPELEKQLIDTHKKGIPVNILEFGSTAQTGERLLALAQQVLHTTKSS